MKTEDGNIHTEMCINANADRPSTRKSPWIKNKKKNNHLLHLHMMFKSVSHTNVIRASLLNINLGLGLVTK